MSVAANQLWQQVTGTLPDEAAKGLIIRFELEAEQDEKASDEQGRPVFVDYEYIEVRSLNDPHSIVHRRVTEADKRMYPQAYRAWKEGTADSVTGTPLKEWPPIAKSQAEMLAFRGIRSVEQFVEVSDDGCHQLGHGFLTLRNKAIAWLQKAKDGSSVTRLAAELQAKDSRIAALERQMTDVVAKYEAQAKAAEESPGKRKGKE